MAGDYDHYEIQTRQRLTSSALNEGNDFIGRMAIESLRRLMNADAASLSGVVDGMRVSVQVGTLNVQISGGLALMYDATQVSPSNKHRWIEIADSAPLTATLDGGDASPRWDVIEIAPGVADAGGEVIDIYDPALGAPVPTILSPHKLCTPIVTVTKGTAGANPKFPAGTAGRIPLAYVYVAAGAAVLNVDRVCYCRPRLRPRQYIDNDLSPYRKINVHGGGWWRLLAGLTGNLETAMTGDFRNGTPFHLPEGAGYNLSSSGNFNGGGLPIANGTIYLYAAPPPYPTGYDANLAPREIYIVDATVMGACYVAGSHNAVVVASLVAPTRDNVGSPATAGTCTITDNLFGTIGIDHADMVYIGSSYFLLGAGTMYAHRSRGAIQSSQVKAGNDINALLPIAADTAISFASSISGDGTYSLPAHVSRIRVVGKHKLDVQGDLTIWFRDYNSMSTSQLKRWTVYRYLAMADIDFGCDMWLDCISSQQLFINYADGNGLTVTNQLRVEEYEDAVLALR
jgi:hypothetical protein